MLFHLGSLWRLNELGYARAADRLGCEAEFMAQALAGEGQFLSCTALGAMIG